MYIYIYIGLGFRVSGMEKKMETAIVELGIYWGYIGEWKGKWKLLLLYIRVM